MFTNENNQGLFCLLHGNYDKTLKSGRRYTFSQNLWPTRYYKNNLFFKKVICLLAYKLERTFNNRSRSSLNLGLLEKLLTLALLCFGICICLEDCSIPDNFNFSVLNSSCLIWLICFSLLFKLALTLHHNCIAIFCLLGFCVKEAFQ